MAKTPSNVVQFRPPGSSGGGRSWSLPKWVPRDLVQTATGWIVLANLTIWLAMVVRSFGRGILTRFPPDLTHAFGSLVPELVPTEPWRMVTSTFIHADLVHIAMNMAILWFTGRQLERAYGRGRFLVLYLAAALGGSVFSITWHLLSDPGTSVGASGGVLGVVAAMCAFFWKATGRNSDLTRQWIWFCGFGFLGGILTSALGVPVDNAAHLGGMLTGFGLSMLFAGRPDWPKRIANAVVGAIAGLVVLGFGLSLSIGHRYEPVTAMDLLPPAERAAVQAFADEDWEKAQAELAIAIEQAPDDPRLRMNRATALRELDRDDEAATELAFARALWTALLKRDPRSAEIGLGYGETLAALDRQEEATVAFVAAAQGEGSGNTFGKLAEKLEERGKLEEASAAAARARKLTNNDSRWREVHFRIKEKIANPPPSAAPTATTETEPAADAVPDATSSAAPEPTSSAAPTP